MSTTRVAILRGGPSEEYDVSLKTGASILENIDKGRFTPIDVVITRSGEWLLDGIVRYPEVILRMTDVVFNALHGSYGEDGTVQTLLDRYCVPYTGSKAFASRVAMNKSLTKDYARKLKIQLPKSLRFTIEDLNRIGEMLKNADKLFTGPVIVKPNCSGSSVGVSKVESLFHLEKEIRNLLEKYDDILVEEFINGREVTCGVLNRYRGQDVYALPPIEIKTKNTNFFDTNSKYSGNTEEICPSYFSNEIKNEIEGIAKTIHSGLNLSQYSRSDMIVTDNGVYFLEVNSLPGLTKNSLLPNSLGVIGETQTGFITHLLEDALLSK